MAPPAQARCCVPSIAPAAAACPRSAAACSALRREPGSTTHTGAPPPGRPLPPSLPAFALLRGRLPPELTAYLDRHFINCSIPTYSCQFNSIENLFGIIKRQYRARVTQLSGRRDYHVNQCRMLVRDICQGLPEDMIQNTLTVNRHYIR